MNIEKESAALQGKLAQLQDRLDHIKRALFSNDGTAAPVAVKATPASKAAPAKKAAPAAKQRRPARGELKQRILDALAAAGKAGMRVRDLAAKLGVKQPALHSWFQFARKNNPLIRKAGKGRYRLAGPVPKVTAATAKPAPKPKAPAAKAKAAPAAKKPAGHQRGQLATAINAELKAAGNDGVRVGDLAKKFNMSPRNLFVWFATTAKKFKDIKKVGPGHYSLQG